MNTKRQRKKLTVEVIKKEREIPKEAVKKAQEYTKIKKQILKSLKSGPKTIPEIAKETGMDTYTVMWYLMTLRKYGEVKETEEVTPDGYYKYEIPRR